MLNKTFEYFNFILSSESGAFGKEMRVEIALVMFFIVTLISVIVYCWNKGLKEELKERFEKIDAVAEFNQLKVLNAMQKNRVSAECFNQSSGYGYNDMGRDTLEDVYARAFHTVRASSIIAREWLKSELYSQSLSTIYLFILFNLYIKQRDTDLFCHYFIFYHY